jgi:hypothetical protein
VVDEEPSDYEEDGFEEVNTKVLKESVTLEQVKMYFEELMIILKIK